MASYQVKYWFESDSRETTGEIVTETVEADSPASVAQEVAVKLKSEVFVVTPSAGPAQDSGLVVINALQVKYVEILPVGTNRY